MSDRVYNIIDLSNIRIEASEILVEVQRSSAFWVDMRLMKTYIGQENESTSLLVLWALRDDPKTWH